MKNQFQFYEVVVVAESDISTIQSVAGQEGTVLGMAQDENSNCWSYAVLISSTGRVWHFEEQQLKPTGRHQERSDFYIGVVVKVQLDPDSGKGSLA